ncbi:MAG: DEAD/DEAH box helicase [Planctomyces sp.]|nr:DEAD/DEAH box helicase [Planctomyces sp.]
MTFQDFALAEPVLRAIVAEGYSVPTPIQALAIPEILQGRDLLGTAQTGTGKTAAFALPILHCLHVDSPPGSNFRKPRVLVISPTRELATQIGDSFQTYGRFTNLRHTVVFGGVSQVPQVRTLRRGVDILVATPGRLLDLLNQGCMRLDEVEVLVLDEADRMLDMGFLPDIRRVIGQLPRDRQTLLFSATMPPAIEALAADLLDDPAQVRIAPVRQTTELIAQSVCHVERQAKPGVLAGYLTSRAVDRAVVFTRTKQSADRVAKRLAKAGISADAIHGDKTQAARQRTLQAFRGSRVAVLVATDVAARGLDIDGVSHVVNYDLPIDPETYVHRIGRTGRAGAAGVAMSLCDPEQRGLLRAVERHLKQKLPIEVVEGLPEGSEVAVAPRPPAAPEHRESRSDADSAGEVASTRDERPRHDRERRFEQRRPAGRDGHRPHAGPRGRQSGPPRGDRRFGGPRPAAGGRPQGERSGEERPRGERPTGRRFQEDRGATSRPQGERRPGARPRPNDRPRKTFRTEDGERREQQTAERPRQFVPEQRIQRTPAEARENAANDTRTNDNVSRKRKFFSKRRPKGAARPGAPNGRRPSRPGGENR